MESKQTGKPLTAEQKEKIGGLTKEIVELTKEGKHDEAQEKINELLNI